MAASPQVPVVNWGREGREVQRGVVGARVGEGLALARAAPPPTKNSQQV